jgi:CRISPR/Cas system CSM-associated protein Csm2 small subunit
VVGAYTEGTSVHEEWTSCCVPLGIGEPHEFDSPIPNIKPFCFWVGQVSSISQSTVNPQIPYKCAYFRKISHKNAYKNTSKRCIQKLRNYKRARNREKEKRMKEIKKGNKVIKIYKKMKGRLGKVANNLSQKMKPLIEKCRKEAESKRGFIVEKLSCTRGISTIEIILILVVLIALIIIFRDQLLTLINNIFDTITSESGSV